MPTVRAIQDITDQLGSVADITVPKDSLGVVTNKQLTPKRYLIQFSVGGMTVDVWVEPGQIAFASRADELLVWTELETVQSIVQDPDGFDGAMLVTFVSGRQVRLVSERNSGSLTFEVVA